MVFNFKNKKKKVKNWLKIILIFLAVFVLFIGLYFMLKHTGFLKKFNNLQEIKLLIKSAGFWSYSVFAVLQFLQVTLIPLPASLTTIAGVILFGPLTAFLISNLSIILGSVFAYACGKFLGEKFLTKFISKEKIKNFQKLFEKGNFIFFIMMLFPFFPDDILCLVAGLSNMNFRFFLLTNLITRTIGLFCLCFLGSGQIIPFSSWGTVVWAVIAFSTATIFIVYFKNKNKIKSFIKKKFFN